MSRISDEELAEALAENLDDYGNDVGLEAWVASWTPDHRARAEANVRRSIGAARRQLKAGQGERSDL